MLDRKLISSILATLTIFLGIPCNAASLLQGCWEITNRFSVGPGNEKKQIPADCIRLYTNDKYISRCFFPSGEKRVTNWAIQLENINANDGVYSVRSLDPGSNPVATKDIYHAKSGTLTTTRGDGAPSLFTQFRRVDSSVCNLLSDANTLQTSKKPAASVDINKAGNQPPANGYVGISGNEGSLSGPYQGQFREEIYKITNDRIRGIYAKCNGRYFLRDKFAGVDFFREVEDPQLSVNEWPLSTANIKNGIVYNVTVSMFSKDKLQRKFYEGSGQWGKWEGGGGGDFVLSIIRDSKGVSLENIPNFKKITCRDVQGLPK